MLIPLPQPLRRLVALHSLRRFVQALTRYQASAIEVKVGYPAYPDTESEFSIWNYYRWLDPASDGYFGTVVTQR